MEKEEAQLEKTGVNQYYGIRAVIALGVIVGLVTTSIEQRKDK